MQSATVHVHLVPHHHLHVRPTATLLVRPVVVLVQPPVPQLHHHPVGDAGAQLPASGPRVRRGVGHSDLELSGGGGDQVGAQILVQEQGVLERAI